MKKLSIKIFNFIYYMQKKRHKKRMELLKKKISSKRAKNGVSININCETDKNRVNYQQNIEKILTKYLNNPEKLFDYIEKTKTPVYKIKGAKKILSYIGELEGFILPQKGAKALYLNLILNKKISTSTPEMFVLSSFSVNIYAFIYQFYNWYCYKMKLKGYEDNVQQKFKHVFEICETSRIDALSYDEILELKTAIKRDIEAIDFVKQFTIKKSTAKKNLDKIKQGQSVNV